MGRGAGLAGDEVGGVDPHGDVVLHRPQDGLVEVVGLLHVHEGVLGDGGLRLPHGPPQEGDGLAPGDGAFGAEAGGADAHGDLGLGVVGPQHRLIEPVALGHVLEGVGLGFGGGVRGGAVEAAHHLDLGEGAAEDHHVHPVGLGGVVDIAVELVGVIGHILGDGQVHPALIEDAGTLLKDVLRRHLDAAVVGGLDPVVGADGIVLGFDRGGLGVLPGHRRGDVDVEIRQHGAGVFSDRPEGHVLVPHDEGGGGAGPVLQGDAAGDHLPVVEGEVLQGVRGDGDGLALLGGGHVRLAPLYGDQVLVRVVDGEAVKHQHTGIGVVVFGLNILAVSVDGDGDRRHVADLVALLGVDAEDQTVRFFRLKAALGPGQAVIMIPAVVIGVFRGFGPGGPIQGVGDRVPGFGQGHGEGQGSDLLRRGPGVDRQDRDQGEGQRQGQQKGKGSSFHGKYLLFVSGVWRGSAL